MIESLDLKQFLKKADYKNLADGMQIRLGELQRQARAHRVPLIP